MEKSRKLKISSKNKRFLKINGIEYINGDNEINSSLDIVNIFSNAKCCIISNSTLSWWGAYLSEENIQSSNEFMGTRSEITRSLDTNLCR